MKNLMLICLVFCLTISIYANDFTISCDKIDYNANEVITIKVKIPKNLENSVWDAYVSYQSLGNSPSFILTQGNKKEPQALGMLPQEIRLKPMAWSLDTKVELNIDICQSGTKKILKTATTSIFIGSENLERFAKGSPRLQLLQDFADSSTIGRAYTDYKQFDSRWKNTRMGQSNGTTIGKDGCAMSAAGNIINWRPDTLNRTLQSNGGYQGNLIIWGKVPGLRYRGSGSISKSLFSSYHVIANVGGHFVLLSGTTSDDRYYSKDPGKSSNPIYSSGQIYSVRLYYR